MYLSPKFLKSVEKEKKTDFFKTQGFRQSWKKVLGIVLEYSYFSVISRFPLKTVQRFRNFLVVLPPPTRYKVESRKKILDTRVQHCLWGEGRGWTCVNWKTPQKCKSVPRLLSMIVGLTMGSVRFSLYLLLVSCIYRSNAHGSLPPDVPPALI